jgi:hypothetical protein
VIRNLEVSVGWETGGAKMADPYSIGISLASLVISASVWWSCIRRGTVKMTRPTMVFLGPDGGGDALPKIFLRTLLFSTAQRGAVVENMFVRLTGGKVTQTFSFWAYTENHDAPSRGSGLFVGPQGSTYNHHFLVPESSASYAFPTGQIKIEVFVQLLGRPKPIPLQTFHLAISEKLKPGSETGLMFDWNPETCSYDARAHSRPAGCFSNFGPMQMLEALSGSREGAGGRAKTALGHGVGERRG